MGILQEKINLSLLVYGNDLADNFKNNSLFFYDKYQKSDIDVTSISVSDIEIGRFYFLHYLDDSNWMKWSPVFVVSFKKFSNMVILFAVNFNFIPLEVRSSIFDKYMIDKNFDDNKSLAVDHKGVYTELLKFGFEYSLIEYNLSQVKFVHRISMNMVPRFLYSQHPQNKYDPNKLMQIWNSKISQQDKRHREMMSALIDDFYDIEGEIKEQYKILKEHILRINKSLEKYGGK
jgi:hypothetical protein